MSIEYNTTNKQLHYQYTLKKDENRIDISIKKAVAYHRLRLLSIMVYSVQKCVVWSIFWYLLEIVRSEVVNEAFSLVDHIQVSTLRREGIE